jgi:hypothetical protein
MKQHVFSFLAFLLALRLMCGIVFWTTAAQADNLYASIRGPVVDPSGAVVPDAKLTATNAATGLAYTVTSGKDGLFNFVQLPIGDYSVKVEKSGFKTFTEGHIHLDLDEIFNLRVAMELGAVTDTVTVEANPAQVETTSMQLSATVTGDTVQPITTDGAGRVMQIGGKFYF